MRYYKVFPFYLHPCRCLFFQFLNAFSAMTSVVEFATPAFTFSGATASARALPSPRSGDAISDVLHEAEVRGFRGRG